MEDKILKQIKSEAENIYPRPNSDVSTVYRWEQKAFIRGAEFGYNIKERVDEKLVEALHELVHLHNCEMEGLEIGQPTAKMWYDAIEKANNALLSSSNQENNEGEKCDYVLDSSYTNYPRVQYKSSCGFIHVELNGYLLDEYKTVSNKLKIPKGKCFKCGKEINQPKEK